MLSRFYCNLGWFLSPRSIKRLVRNLYGSLGQLTNVQPIARAWAEFNFMPLCLSSLDCIRKAYNRAFSTTVFVLLRVIYLLYTIPNITPATARPSHHTRPGSHVRATRRACAEDLLFKCGFIGYFVMKIAPYMAL